MADPTRVLWLIKGLGPGGAERLLVDAARWIDRERFQVHAAYLLPNKGHLVEELAAEGVDATCLGARGDLDPAWIVRLRTLVRDRRIDLVHVHSPVAAATVRIALRGPAIVTTEHNTWDRYRWSTRWVDAMTFGRQDAAIAVSAEVARSITRPRPSATVIPNGVDVERLRRDAMSRDAARAALDLPHDVPVVGTIGGVTAKKGHVHLVRAVRAVAAAIPEVRFAIVGLPIDPEPVRRAIERAGVEERVAVVGYRPDAARLLPAFDVFVLPSLHEGMPVALLEAMAAGLSVVATRVGGVPEVVSDGVDGVLVPPGDEDALADALIDLLADPRRREAIGAAAAATARRFSLEDSVRATEQVYEAALTAREARR